MSTRVNDAASGTPPVPQAPVEAAPLRRLDELARVRFPPRRPSGFWRPRPSTNC